MMWKIVRCALAGIGSMAAYMLIAGAAVWLAGFAAGEDPWAVVKVLICGPPLVCVVPLLGIAVAYTDWVVDGIKWF